MAGGTSSCPTFLIWPVYAPTHFEAEISVVLSWADPRITRLCEAIVHSHEYTNES